MSTAKVTDAEVDAAIRAQGGVRAAAIGRPAAHDIETVRAMVDAHGATEAARILGYADESVPRLRLKRAEAQSMLGAHPSRLEHRIVDGVALIGSDAHIWPGPLTTAFRGFLWAIGQLRPKLVVLNGDVMDCATNSRYPSIGWEKKPTLAEEIAAAQQALLEIQATTEARLVWPLGNHDLRFETRLATIAPEYRDVEGIHLKDHFPDWEPCWSLWVNPGAGNTPLVIKHRFKGGTNATHNNTLYAGMSTATGHLHSLRVSPFSDYWGTRYGVDTGTLARPYGPQFTNYTEDNPVNWRSGFAVFTWRGGRMLQPELVQVWDEDKGVIEFRGELFTV